jgi:hypothetical protein
MPVNDYRGVSRDWRQICLVYELLFPCSCAYPVFSMHVKLFCI